MSFQFTHPHWLLLLPPAWAWLVWLAWKSDVSVAGWRRGAATALRLLVATLLLLGIAGLQWRNVGPFRGGRTRAVSGVPGQRATFYVGAVNGGVWKTTDAGRTWSPIFDDQPTGSIGAIAVAPSNPDIIYVGSGEGLHRPDLSIGMGMFKSTDGGATWTHLGLRDTHQIPQIAVDPANPDRLFVAAWPPPDVADAIAALPRPVEPGVRYTPREQWHVTLLFLGTVPIAPAIRASLLSRIEAKSQCMAAQCTVESPPTASRRSRRRPSRLKA